MVFERLVQKIGQWITRTPYDLYTLPPEIWDACIQHCSDLDDLLNLSLTCRLFCALTRPLRFRRISFLAWRNGIGEYSKKQWLLRRSGHLKYASKRLSYLSTHRELVLLVRHIEFTGIDLSIFPDDRISLPATSFRSHYRRLLSDLMVSLPRFQRLESIKLFELRMNNALSVALNQITSLRRVDVWGGWERPKPDAARMNAIRLQGLTSLSIRLPITVSRNGERVVLPEDIPCIIFLLEACPNLKEFDISAPPKFRFKQPLRSTLPWHICRRLRVLKAPPELIAVIIPGRPVERLEIICGCGEYECEELKEALQEATKSAKPIRELHLPRTLLGDVLHVVTMTFPDLERLSGHFRYLFDRTNLPPTHFKEEFLDWLATGKYPLPPFIEEIQLNLGYDYASEESILEFPEQDISADFLTLRHRKALELLRCRYASLSGITIGSGDAGRRWIWAGDRWLQT
ncbi:hypothetical protein CVT26_003781 [Gymnopilus dilepis]|uniref:F-box domain-containing protein n=1 Tax=Gymnopilus dilepis TaxID=231916 RepID=A0A409W1R6_9AGAR|nr:hypothetical protein CVT26_003781 [Gymnopilus dilepis]